MPVFFKNVWISIPLIILANSPQHSSICPGVSEGVMQRAEYAKTAIHLLIVSSSQMRKLRPPTKGLIKGHKRDLELESLLSVVEKKEPCNLILVSIS